MGETRLPSFLIDPKINRNTGNKLKIIWLVWVKFLLNNKWLWFVPEFLFYNAWLQKTSQDDRIIYYKYSNEKKTGLSNSISKLKIYLVGQNTTNWFKEVRSCYFQSCKYFLTSAADHFQLSVSWYDIQKKLGVIDHLRPLHRHAQKGKNGILW